MSSSTIKKILNFLSVFGFIGMAIWGASIGVDKADYDERFLYGFLGFIIEAVVGFGVMIMCFAIGNALADLERTADAAEEIAYKLKFNDNDSSQKSGNSSTISKLSAINRDETYVSDTWTCKKCGRVNEKASMTCKDCGEYK